MSMLALVPESHHRLLARQDHARYYRGRANPCHWRDHSQKLPEEQVVSCCDIMKGWVLLLYVKEMVERRIGMSNDARVMHLEILID